MYSTKRTGLLMTRMHQLIKGKGCIRGLKVASYAITRLVLIGHRNQ